MPDQERDQDIVRCLKAMMAGDYSVSPKGEDELSITLRKTIARLRSSTQNELSRVIDLSVQANETAIFSAHMLSNLRKVDERAHSIAAAAEEMVTTVQEIGRYGNNIASQAKEAQQASNEGSVATRNVVAGM